MIRIATAYDIPALKKIWDESFHDPINYIDFIFDRLAKPTDAVVYEDAGKIASMLLMIDAKFVWQNESVGVIYILGAATAKQYQNKGIMTYLLNHTESLARQNGAQLTVLVPGERYLYNYYKKRGYSADFDLRQIRLKPGMLELSRQPDEPVIVDRVSPDFIFSVRDEALKNQPFIQWNVERMKSVMEDSFIYGDHVAAYTGELGSAYAFYRSHKRSLFIRECLGSTKEAQLMLIKELIRLNNSRNAQLMLPVRSTLFEHEGETIPYGMAKPLNTSSYLHDIGPYMNLMFD